MTENQVANQAAEQLAPAPSPATIVERSDEFAELATALALASSEVPPVPKSGFNRQQNYKYSTDGDVALATRAPMAKHGLSLIPVQVEAETVAAKTIYDKPTFRTTVTCRYLLTHKSGQWIILPGVGTAMDTGDKGLYKAQTGALKYVLKTLFNLACGEDPEVGGEDDGPASKAKQKSRSSGSDQQSTGDAWKDAEPDKNGKKLSDSAISGLRKVATGNGIKDLDEVLTITLACSASDLTQGNCYRAVRRLIETGALLQKAQRQANAA